MAQTENTAVNRLIELAGSKPIDSGDDPVDLFASEPPRPKKPTPPPPFRQSQPMTAVAPPRGTPAPEILPRVVEPVPAPMPAPRVTAPMPAPRVTAPMPAPAPRPATGRFSKSDDDWFDAHEAEDEHDRSFGTHIVKRKSGGAFWWVAGAFGLGIAIAALLFYPDLFGTKKQAAAAPATAAVPAAAPEPVAVAAAVPAAAAPAAAVPAIEPLPAPEPEPATTTATATATATTAAGEVVRFESNPPGAMVILVENGVTTPVGKAPIEFALEPGKRYEAMFSLEGHASVIVPVDGTSKTIAASLASAGQPSVAAAPAVEPAAPPVAEPVADDEPAPVECKARKAEKKKEKRVARAEPPKKEKASGGDGVLMIASKPPCEIVVDGKRTGLRTPQRSLDLAPGKHTITLVNREHGIKEKVTVTIKAGQTSKVIKDLTSRMK